MKSLFCLPKPKNLGQLKRLNLGLPFKQSETKKNHFNLISFPG